MIKISIDHDENNHKHYWLVVQRPGVSVQQIKIENNEEARKIINALSELLKKND